jgi:hypothetical protein
MNFADYIGSEVKPTAPSLKWWIEHKAKPVPIAGTAKLAIPRFESLRIYPKPPVEEALKWARKFASDGVKHRRIAGLVAKKINRSQKRAAVYIDDFLRGLQAK